MRKGDMMVKCNKKLISTKDLSYFIYDEVYSETLKHKHCESNDIVTVYKFDDSNPTWQRTEPEEITVDELMDDVKKYIDSKYSDRKIVKE